VVLALYFINIIRLTPIFPRVYLTANLVVIDFINMRFRGNFSAVKPRKKGIPAPGLLLDRTHERNVT
jgi:hypothetical protein